MYGSEMLMPNYGVDGCISRQGSVKININAIYEKCVMYQCACVGLLRKRQSNICSDQFRQFLYFRNGNFSKIYLFTICNRL